MLFNSFIFIVFLVVVIPLYYYSSKQLRKYLLFVASYIFYGYWDYRFCSLLLLSTIIDFVTGKLIYENQNEKRRKIYLYVSLFSNLGILGFFKYFNFFVDSFDSTFSMMGLQLDFLHLNIILPVGISFYTFQTLTYTIDIYRRNLKATDSFLDFSIYVAFFPQLVAGPIERAIDLLPQISKMPTPTLQQFKQGIVLITIGMFKKVMIGDTTGRIVDQIIAESQYFSSTELLMALVLFSIQIYADFSGYSSIARGTAKFMGIELMENFNQPYLSRNITEFWRRWHISLSSWLRDYLYITLGGNKKGSTRTYLNLMLTMLIGGLWHGANWTFVVWGGLHGIYLSIHKLYLKNRKIESRFHYTNLRSFIIFIMNVIITNILVLLTWLFFRAKTFDDAFVFLNKFVFWDSGDFVLRSFIITATFSLVIIIIDIFEYYYQEHDFLLKLKFEYRLGIIIPIWLVIFLYMFQATPLPFIYFQF